MNDLEQQIEKRLALVKKASDGTALFALVTTPRFLLLVDLKSKNVIPVESERTEYYGVSWLPGSLDLILSHSAIDNYEMKDISNYALSEVGYLSHGKTLSPPFLSQPHQILCGSDGRIICTNTGRNAVSVFDFQKPNRFEEVRLSSARWDRLALDNITGDHLNSLFEKNGRLYVLAHGHNRASTLATLSYPDLQIMNLQKLQNKSNLHNVWITDEGQKICCHSLTGGLLDIDANEILWQANAPIYTRGLAATSEFVLVGETQSSGRLSRNSSISGLWLLDRRDWRPLDYFCLGPYGAVHDVRLINIRDEAHHGYLFEGIATLLTRDLRKTIAIEKLTASVHAWKKSEAWEDFELVFGCPRLGKDGATTAQPGSLCLLTQLIAASASPKQLDFRYSLDGPPGDSHVSVVSYRGKGTDTNMHALLFQRVNETQANLNLWIHNGVSWAMQTQISQQDMPLTADISVSITFTGIRLSIDKQVVLNLSPADMPCNDGVFGIRWAGATISPAKKVLRQI